MEIAATFIATADTVEACRTAQDSVPFTCPLSSTGDEPATHYAGNGHVPQADIDALSGLCDVTIGDISPHTVFLAVGLKMIETKELL